MRFKIAFAIYVCFLLGTAYSFSQKIVETDYFSANPELGGEVVIQKSTTEVKGQTSIVSFEVEAPSSGEYYLNFWLMPTKLSDGSYAKYAVAVNGEELSGRISPTSGDWQSISLANREKVSLQSGKNTVSVIGNAPDVPSVEHIRLSKNDTSIDASKYKAYRSAAEKENLSNISKQSSIVIGDTIPSNDLPMRAAAYTDNPLYNYTYALNVSFKYTFYKTVSFTKGQQIFLATTGIDKFAHILELFSASAPESYSWSSISNSNCLASLNITIPASGLYYVRVRSYLNARSGFCNLNINGENFYERVPLYSTGFRCTQNTGTEYNTFTCYREGDPRLWIEEGAGIPGKISAFNDDYGSHGGNYSWSLNSRIKKKYSRPVHAALLSAYSSYNPSGKCDLYIKCMNSTVMPYFENLKDDGAIQSAPASTTYNCISWSGGITSYWEWPPSPSSTYYDKDPLKAFDKFYAARGGYTRTGANKNNAIVALWATVDNKGNRSYTHASVTKGDGNAHGYDWESKPGSLMRTFHPCDALNGSSYGQIVEYYTSSTRTSSRTLAEEVADGITTIEYVDFNIEETSLIKDKINLISDNTVKEFNQLYQDWNRIIENTPYGNPLQITNCIEYKNIFEFCSNNIECLYNLYDKLQEGDIASVILIENLTLTTPERKTLMDEVREEIPTLSRSGAKIVRPLQSNCIAYVKKLLSRDISSPIKRTLTTAGINDISYSNSQSFSIQQTSSAITIDFELKEQSNVLLNVTDVMGNMIASAFNGQQLKAGHYSETINIPSDNIYLVQLIINGKVNVKKIISK